MEKLYQKVSVKLPNGFFQIKQMKNRHSTTLWFALLIMHCNSALAAITSLVFKKCSKSREFCTVWVISCQSLSKHSWLWSVIVSEWYFNSHNLCKWGWGSDLHWIRVDDLLMLLQITHSDPVQNHPHCFMLNAFNILPVICNNCIIHCHDLSD